MNIIETNNLTKFYKKKYRGIENLNLTVQKGEIFGFIGPNGAGKSTTIRTLLNYIYAEGNASIFGLDVVKDTVKIKQDVGYLPSEVIMYDDLTILNLLNYSAQFYNKDCSERIIYLCSKFDLDTSKKIDELSFGNRKKVGIICALLHEPKLLILDEPTSGLDPLMQKVFFEILLEEKAKGTTIFFSSHILSEIKKVCDRVGIIKDGKIISIKSVEELTKVNHIMVTIKSDEINRLDFLNTVTVKEHTKEKITFIFEGSINDLLSKINVIKLESLLIEEPDIEEVFMHYYN